MEHFQSLHYASDYNRGRSMAREASGLAFSFFVDICTFVTYVFSISDFLPDQKANITRVFHIIQNALSTAPFAPPSVFLFWRNGCYDVFIIEL